MKYFALLLFALIATNTAGAGQFNQTLSIGDKAPEWKELPGVDDKTHSLSDFASKDVVVVVFTCNSCPIASDYEARIIDFAKKYAADDAKVGVVAINVNRIAEDQLPKMKERAEAKGFPYPYIYDETQKIAKDYGANFTPEVFVLDRERKIAYMGGIDDSSDPKQAKQHYLVAAVQAVLDGKTPEVKETPAIGCRIRFARERRGKAKQ